MALNIRNPEAERLAEALANLTGETKTAAVRPARVAAAAPAWPGSPTEATTISMQVVRATTGCMLAPAMTPLR